MAEWNKGKVLPQNLHNNQEFENGDNLAINELNAIVNNSFYASEKAEQSETTSKEALDKINQFVQDEGKTAVTLNGEVQPTWSADFAEAERQKSKNLFDPNFLTLGATIFTDGSFVITANYVTTSQKINVDPNSQLVMSANIGIDQDSGFVFYNNGVYVGYAKGVSTTTVPSNANQVVLNFHATGITPQGITTPQLEYGSVATDYQPYNGATIHEKELKEVSSKKELLYNIHNDFINITESSLTTFQEYFDLFNLDKNKTYTCNIGNLESSNFKNLVGKPAGFVNYVNCLIKNVVVGSGNIERNTTYQLLALDRYANGVAIGYIYKDNNAIIQFTGWTIIGKTSSSGGSSAGSSVSLKSQTGISVADFITLLQNVGHEKIFKVIIHLTSTPERLNISDSVEYYTLGSTTPTSFTLSLPFPSISFTMGSPNSSTTINEFMLSGQYSDDSLFLNLSATRQSSNGQLLLRVCGMKGSGFIFQKNKLEIPVSNLDVYYFE